MRIARRHDPAKGRDPEDAKPRQATPSTVLRPDLARITQLQQTVGNQATTALIQRRGGQGDGEGFTELPERSLSDDDLMDDLVPNMVERVLDEEDLGEAEGEEGGNYLARNYLVEDSEQGSEEGGNYLARNYLVEDSEQGSEEGGNYLAKNYLMKDSEQGSEEGGNYLAKNYLAKNYLAKNYLMNDSEEGGNYLARNYLMEGSEQDSEDDEAQVAEQDDEGLDVKHLLGDGSAPKMRRLLAVVRRELNLGNLAFAQRWARHVSMFAEDFLLQNAGAQLYAQAGGTNAEQGTGPVGQVDREVEREQQSLRLAATLMIADPSRFAVSEGEQGDSGWALTGLGHHGSGMDPGLLESGTLDYHDDERQQQHIARLVDGQFRRLDDTVVSSSLTEENVGNRMGLALNVRVVKIMVDKLREAGMEDLASQLASLGNMDESQIGLVAEGRKQLGIRRSELVNQAKTEIIAEGRMIYVMNRSGDFFIGDAEFSVTHHSSFLAGGAVACAGEVALSGGRVTAISNNSGHYQPGPAFLWQAVRQLQISGADISGVMVDIVGAGQINAMEFLQRFNPAYPPMSPRHLSMDSAFALEQVRHHLAGHEGPLPEQPPQVQEEPEVEDPVDDEQDDIFYKDKTQYQEEEESPYLMYKGDRSEEEDSEFEDNPYLTRHSSD